MTEDRDKWRKYASMVWPTLGSTTAKEQNRTEQKLVWKCTDAFLFALDGELESRQAHVLVVVRVLQLAGGRRVQGVGDRRHRLRVVVQDHLELLGAACLVKQLDGKVAALLRQLFVLVLHSTPRRRRRHFIRSFN